MNFQSQNQKMDKNLGRYELSCITLENNWVICLMMLKNLLKLNIFAKLIVILLIRLFRVHFGQMTKRKNIKQKKISMKFCRSFQILLKLIWKIIHHGCVVNLCQLLTFMQEIVTLASWLILISTNLKEELGFLKNTQNLQNLVSNSRII